MEPLLLEDISRVGACVASEVLVLPDNLAVTDEPSASGTIFFAAVTAYERHLGLGTDGTR